MVSSGALYWADPCISDTWPVGIGALGMEYANTYNAFQPRSYHCIGFYQNGMVLFQCTAQISSKKPGLKKVSLLVSESVSKR